MLRLDFMLGIVAVVVPTALDDEEPSGTEFSPDGGYIPRILFLNSAGDVQNEVYNKQGSDQYKYYYSDSGAVLKGMQDAAEHFA
eukprot:gene581-30140_t